MELENEINLGPPAVTTDVEKYLDLLMDCYNDGFTLATFVRVPEVNMSTDVTNWISDQPYQAILTKQDAVGYVLQCYGHSTRPLCCVLSDVLNLSH